MEQRKKTSTGGRPAFDRAYIYQYRTDLIIDLFFKQNWGTNEIAFLFRVDPAVISRMITAVRAGRKRGSDQVL